MWAYIDKLFSFLSLWLAPPQTVWSLPRITPLSRSTLVRLMLAVVTPAASPPMPSLVLSARSPRLMTPSTALLPRMVVSVFAWILSCSHTVDTYLSPYHSSQERLVLPKVKNFHSYRRMLNKTTINGYDRKQSANVWLFLSLRDTLINVWTIQWLF